MDAIIFSRRDTFKEQITRAYANKEGELDHYRKRCDELESQEQSFTANTREREQLALVNLQLTQELEGLRITSQRDSKLLKQNVQKAQDKLAKDEKSRKVLKHEHSVVKDNLSTMEDEL